jgi:hypothetical protein
METFGTAIRGKVTGANTTRELIGVFVTESGQHTLQPQGFHSHGVNIGLSTKDADLTTMDVYGIQALGNVIVHSPATAYNLSPGSGAKAYRVTSDGTAKVEAPYHWSAGTAAPAVTSLNGEDLFVETDCDVNGCSGTGNQPHLMIYSTACPTSNPWFDVARNLCRQ